MEPGKKEMIDLSHLSKREELEKVAQICDKLNDLFEKSAQKTGTQEEMPGTKEAASENAELKKKL